MTADAQDLTVEQLAFETGMSVRNIRNHQSRGLLPPPEVRNRVGYYGRAHVERLRLIQEMQAEGYNLTAIQRLLSGDASAERFVGLRRAMRAPTESEAPEVLTLRELSERVTGDGEPNVKALDKAVKLGIVVPLGDDRYEVPSPSLLRAAEEVVRGGVPLEQALRTIEKVQANAQSSARAFVRLFLEELWKPFDADGRPDDRWADVTQSIERLRPLAGEVEGALFRQAMTAAVEDAFGKVLERGKD